MTAPGVPPAGAVALRDRALAPDAARGAMLLLIALANVHFFLFDRPLGVRSYPAALTGLDGVVAGVQLVLVDGRAYPLFGLLFGYGLGQLAARRAAAGVEERVVVRLVRRRGRWLVAIGAVHVVLLWSGDIVAAYGVLAVALGAVVVSGTALSLATTAVVGSVLGAGLGAFSAFSPPGTAPLPSVAVADPVTAAVERISEWAGGIVIGSLISVVGAVALGALAARFRVLDEPAAHRRLLGRVAAAGLGTAVLTGLPLALAAVGVWRPGEGLLMLAAFLHTLGGYAGGLGYAALFGLLVIRRGAAAPLIRRVARIDAVRGRTRRGRIDHCARGVWAALAVVLPGAVGAVRRAAAGLDAGPGRPPDGRGGGPAGRRGVARAAAGGRGVGPRRVPRPGGDPAARSPTAPPRRPG